MLKKAFPAEVKAYTELTAGKAVGIDEWLAKDLSRSGRMKRGGYTAHNTHVRVTLEKEERDQSLLTPKTSPVTKPCSKMKRQLRVKEKSQNALGRKLLKTVRAQRATGTQNVRAGRAHAFLFYLRRN